MSWDLIIKFIIMMLVIAGIIIFVLYKFIFKSTDGAMDRLSKETEAALQKQAELSKKIKEADQELERRKKELDAIEQKMAGEIQAEAEKEREDMISKARQDAEDIITRAQASSDNIRKEIEKNMELKIIDYSAKILNEVLSQKAKGALDQQLAFEFTDKLKDVDMSRIPANIESAEILATEEIDNKIVSDIQSIIKEKLNRSVSVNSKTDESIVGGVALQFGSLMLDGSLQNSIREKVTLMKEEIEKDES